MLCWGRKTDAHQLSNPAAATAAALRVGIGCFGNFLLEFFRHQILLVAMGIIFPDNCCTIQEECKPPATGKPIAERTWKEVARSSKIVVRSTTKEGKVCGNARSSAGVRQHWD